MNIDPTADRRNPLPNGEAISCDPWLRKAQQFTKGAERAFEAGDTAASIALAVGAAQCLRIHKNLKGID